MWFSSSYAFWLPCSTTKRHVASIIWTTSYWYFCRWRLLANQDNMNSSPYPITISHYIWWSLFKPICPTNPHIQNNVVVCNPSYYFVMVGKIQVFCFCAIGWLWEAFYFYTPLHTHSFCFSHLIHNGRSISHLHIRFTDLYPPTIVDSSHVFSMFPHSLDAEIYWNP